MEQIFKIQIIAMALILVFFSGLTCIIQAAPPEQSKSAPTIPTAPKETVLSIQSKEIQGEVTWIGKDKIAIVYKKDVEHRSEEEIVLPIDKKVSLQHLKSISDVAAGDTVYLLFEESTEEGPGGPKLSRIVKKIGFIRKGQKKPIPALTPETPLKKDEEEGWILKSQ